MKINSLLPSISASAYKDGSFTDIKLPVDSDHKWKVFFFYPADFTFVCPTELEDMAQHYPSLKEMGVEVYAVSTDTHFAHKAWHDSSPAIKKVDYFMVGDPSHSISKAFGVLDEGSGLAGRGTYVFNPKGELKIMEVHDDGIGRNAAELVQKIKAAQYVDSHPGEVCPAKWKEGDKTLSPSLDLVGKI